MSVSDILTGRLHVFVAFDWGEEMDLARAKQQGAGVFLDMVRRPRTPVSIAYRVPPLRFPLGPIVVSMPGLEGSSVRSAEATVFDFAGVSVALVIPFSLTRGELRALAARLTESPIALGIMQTARAILEPLYHKLLPAITRPHWPDSLWEEYFVFQFSPAPEVDPEALLTDHAEWLAGLLRLEDEELSEQEINDALRLRLRYGTRDLFVPDWGAGVLVDHEGESDETLQAVEFANLQLLEYRHIDHRLDDTLARADALLTRSARTWLPLFGHSRDARQLGELKVEANGLFERTGNVLKLVGDQYLSRVYKLVATRFYLPEWKRSIEHKLEVLEGIYAVLSNQAQHLRSEVLELLIVILILVEIAISLIKPH